MTSYLANKYGLYVPGATWISAFSSAVQAEINRNQWNEKQANAYVQLQTNYPTMLTTGLISWFNAGSIGVSNGANVATWPDQTGNFTVTQSTTAQPTVNQPTYVTADSNFNGLPPSASLAISGSIIPIR